ncbi:glycosyltransferase [Novosphingobium colocasiae]
MQAGDTIGHAITALQFMERELLLFATFWFIIGALDDLAIDVCWLWLRLTGRSPALGISRAEVAGRLEGRIAVLIAAWQEGAVIGHTIRHALGAWPQPELTLYLGCYRNDPGTIAAAMAAAGNDPRLRIVIHERAGPTTKADCLNRLYRALAEDERRTDQRFRTVVIHDAEDMVHPAELAVIDRAIGSAGLVQLPVRPEPQPRSPWIGGHYCEEFTEAHAKLLVVRDALRVPVPAAGVGCGIARDLLDLLAARRLREGEGDGGPFSTTCLTEDYELGYLVWREGRRTRFIRVRDEDGELVATRAYFSRLARSGGAPEGAVDTRHCVSGVGAAGLGHAARRLVDDAARPARAVLGAGAGLRLCPGAGGTAAGAGPAGADRYPAPAITGAAGDAGHLRGRTGVARGCAFRFHDARIRAGRRAAGAAAHPGRQCHRHHRRPSRAGDLCAHAARRDGALGQDRAYPPPGGRWAGDAAERRRTVSGRLSGRGQPLVALLTLLAGWAGGGRWAGKKCRHRARPARSLPKCRSLPRARRRQRGAAHI